MNSRTQLENLVHMANQIAANVDQSGGDEAAAEKVATHLQKFWARSMKQQIVDYARQDGSDLAPIAQLAVSRLADATRETGS